MFGPVNPVVPLVMVRLGLHPRSASPYDTARLHALVSLSAAPVMNEPPPGGSVDSTFELLRRAKAGDSAALERLLTRYLPALRRWSSGRLPRWSRDLLDTDDIVQETVIRVVKRIDTFESRREGALLAYLRQAVMNRIRDELRRSHRAPGIDELDENQRDRSASPLEITIGREAVERYETALARLRPEEREAIVARIELDGTYQDVAQALGKASPDAARMAVSRALLRLAEEMDHGNA